MARTLPLSDIEAMVGGTLSPSRWITVDQDRIDRFADVTEDRQFIHVDPERAARTPFGTTIAHGFLSLSLLSAMVPDDFPEPEGAMMSVNFGFDRVRFIEPVQSGTRVRSRLELLAYEARKPKQHQFRWDVTVEIEGARKPALKAEWLTLTMTMTA